MEQTDLLKGSIPKTLFFFALPFLLANFIQALFGAVDMIIIGWYEPSESIAAVSLGAQISMIIIRIAGGLTVGGTILMSQYYGAGRLQDTKETIGTILTLFSIVALVLTVLMFLLVDPFLLLLQTPKEAFQETRQYVLICSLGNIVIFGYNSISAILRGLGDSKSPLWFIAIACIINILLDLLFIGQFRWGVAGAAIATVLAQLASVVFAVFYLKRSNFLFKFEWSNFRICREKVPSVFRLGIPVTVQDMLTSTSFLFITAIVNSLGYTATAAVGISSRFVMFAMLPSISFAMALAALVAQNMGANQQQRARTSFFLGIFFSLFFALPFFLWAQISPESIMRIFGADPEVVRAGTLYMKSFSFDFLLVAFVFCQTGFFNGCGRTRFVMVNGIIAALLLRLPLSWLFGIGMNGDLWMIGLAAPLASFVQIFVGFLYLRRNRWKIPIIPKE
ncbi:MAG: MATE family efflux transporter [Planctomycetia bacterium]|nr:MATE family efflux transporter [Planctomycetia bacterium]